MITNRMCIVVSFFAILICCLATENKKCNILMLIKVSLLLKELIFTFYLLLSSHKCTVKAKLGILVKFSGVEGGDF